jgi:hypothetical protein
MYMDCGLFVITRDTVRVICRCNQQAPSNAVLVTAALGANPKQFLMSFLNDAVSFFNIFYIFLTVRLRIILVSNQLDAQFLQRYVYLNSLHVSSNYVLILRRTIVLIQHLV